MHKGSRSALLIACITGLPVAASEVGVLFDKQFGESVSYSDFRATAIRPTGFAIRGAYTLLDLKAFELGLTATYHPKSEANSEYIIGSLSMPLGISTVGNKYAAIGVQADWKVLVDLHLGMEARQETISCGGPLTVISIPSPPPVLLHVEPGSTTIVRPWAKAGLGFTFPSIAVKPFIRLEMAYSVKTYPSLSSSVSANGEDFRKRVAPTFQVAFYGGIRF